MTPLHAFVIFPPLFKQNIHSGFSDIFITDSTEDTRNPTQYWVGDHDLDIQAIFERNSELTFTPSAVEIPATGGIQTIVVSASKKWALDPLPENWAKVTPMSGDEGETPIRIEIDQQG